MNKVRVIVNPSSAKGRTAERWITLKEIIHQSFKEYKYIFTEKPAQATEIARDLLKDGSDLIIGVGGDGTLNEITNGYFEKDSNRIINADASLAIIPSGTGSDFIRYMKIPKDFKKCLELIKNSKNRKIDVGQITFNNLNIPNQPSSINGNVNRPSTYFINVADFGLGAEVARYVSAIPSGKRGAFSYYKGLLSTLRTYKSQGVRIIIDDKEELEGRFLIGAIANGPIFGGGMKIAPDAEPDDGYFDLVLVEDMKRFETIKNSWHLYTGTVKTHPKVVIKRAKNIKVFPKEDNETPVNIEYDGETGPSLPAEFKIIQRTVNFRI